MTRATPLAYQTAAATAPVERAAAPRAADPPQWLAQELRLTLHTDLDAVADEWRSFERVADCTAFQTFDWLNTWQRHIGRRDGIIPVIATGIFADGATAFIAPLAIDPRRTRRLCWLGQETCDYNAPLLARDFAASVAADRFVATWHRLLAMIGRDPELQYDWIELEKMPQTVGGQINPFTYLGVTPNPSSAYLTELGADWQTFYYDKRSSATRRHDRAKRRRMAQQGEVRLVTCTEPADVRSALDLLICQKRRTFAHRGIPDIFARPELRDFLVDLASNPDTRHLVHVSRIDVGSTTVAANFAILFGGCYYHVLASYDDQSAVAPYGPGSLHLRELLAYAIGLRLSRFDFTIGDEPYKLEWCDTTLKLLDYSAAISWRGWPPHAASLARRSIKRFIKQTPVIWNLFARLRARLAVPSRTVRRGVRTDAGISADTSPR